MAVYQEPGGLYSCEAPSQWRVQERPEERSVSFFGPPGGPKPYSSSISIYYYPKSGADFRTPEEYHLFASGERVSPLQERPWGKSKAFEFTAARRQMVRHGPAPFVDLRSETVLIPREGGFFALVHSASADAFDSTRPVFSAVLAKFHAPD